MCAVVVFGLLTTVVMVVDVSTGGRIRIRSPDGESRSSGLFDSLEEGGGGGDTGHHQHGSFNADLLFPVVCAAGIVYGMVELIRRVIPRDIVGGEIDKLRRVDALVNTSPHLGGGERGHQGEEVADVGVWES